MLSFLHMTQHTFRVIIEPDGKRFHAYVPVLPGCHTHGKTIVEAQKYISEAIELYNDSDKKGWKTFIDFKKFTKDGKGISATALLKVMNAMK